MADIEHMSLWEYEARLYHWNEAHGGGDDIQPPDPETAIPMLDKINSDPRLTQGVNIKQPKRRKAAA